MSISVNGIPFQYDSYTVDVARVKQKIEKQNASVSYNDSTEISAEGKKVA